jgi:hypothetical protein
VVPVLGSGRLALTGEPRLNAKEQGLGDNRLEVPRSLLTDRRSNPAGVDGVAKQVVQGLSSQWATRASAQAEGVERRKQSTPIAALVGVQLERLSNEGCRCRVWDEAWLESVAAVLVAKGGAPHPSSPSKGLPHTENRSLGPDVVVELRDPRQHRFDELAHRGVVDALGSRVQPNAKASE